MMDLKAMQVVTTMVDGKPVRLPPGVLPRYLSGGSWRNKTGGGSHNPSRTTGKSKGIRPTSLQKWACRRNRSYKDRDYAAIMEGVGKRTAKSGS